MNRDVIPDPAAVALATGEMMVAARRAVVPGPAAASVRTVTSIRAALAALWPKMPPEAVRDVLSVAAEGAAEAGITEVPGPVTSRYSYEELTGAITLLDMAGAWFRAGKPAPRPGRPAPHKAYASSAAFDRDEDDETLTTLAVLLALAFTAVPAGGS